MPVIEKDVDGPNSLPLRLDGEVPNLGKFSATPPRRPDRSISAPPPPPRPPTAGLEDRRVKLGCVMPGESPAIFGDALRRLAGAATYLYQDGPRYWYSTQPTVTKLAEDRAEQLKRDPDKVVAGTRPAPARRPPQHRRLQPGPPPAAVRRWTSPTISTPAWSCSASTTPTARKPAVPPRSPPRRSWRRAATPRGSTATRSSSSPPTRPGCKTWTRPRASTSPGSRSSPRRSSLNLDPQQVKQAETQRIAADGTVTARIPEVYHWLIVPTQKTPQSPVEWQAFRLPSGHDALAVRVSKKLRNDESLITGYAGSSLKMELDRVPLWRDDRHVAVKQLAEDFARYVYLPRLKDSNVLIGAVRDGAGLLTWEEETFAFADGFDEATGRYRGLRGGQHVSLVDSDSPGLLVKGAVARAQLDADAAKADIVVGPGPQVTGGGGSTTTGTGPGQDRDPGRGPRRRVRRHPRPPGQRGSTAPSPSTPPASAATPDASPRRSSPTSPASSAPRSPSPSKSRPRSPEGPPTTSSGPSPRTAGP